MPALFRQTLIFQGPGHGWTESLYFQQATEDVAAAQAFVSDNKNKRRPLLGAQGSIVGERIALVQDLAGLKVTRIGTIQQFSLPGTQAQPMEDTSTSLEVLWVDAFAKYKKITFLGGAWASIFPFANSYDPSAGNWTTFLNQWVANCIALGLGWRHRTLAATNAITNYTTNAASGITTYTVRGEIPQFMAGLNPILSTPFTVGVEFFGQKSPLDGVQVVIPTNFVPAVVGPPAVPATWTIETASPRPARAFTTQGTFKTFGSAFVTPAALNGQGQPGTIKAQKPVGRKRGRPLLVSRGRAAVRVRF